MNKNLIIVTGDPRSGTSMMMRILDLLGVEVAGEDMPGLARLEAQIERTSGEEKKRLEEQKAERAAKMREMNPNGFYEVPGVVMRGLDRTSAAKYAGRAIKIISPGCVRTPIDVVDKYIVCLRDPTSVAQSQTHLEDNVKIAGVAGWENPTKQPQARRYMLENGGLAAWLADNTAARDKALAIDYDEMIDDTAAQVAKLVAHLGIKPVRQQVDAAIASVDPTLRRSADAFKGWPDGDQDGEIAESVYAALYTLDKSNLDTVEASVETRRDFYRREGAIWFDPATGVNGSKAAHARLADATLRAKWLDGETVTIGGKQRKIRGYKQEIRQGLHCLCSPDFKELEETYTVRRPVDLGDLDQRMVEYDGVKMTYEVAEAVHQRRWAEGTAKLLPLAARVALAEGVA